ncbi:porin family protein [Pedobacter duraquae]|uniref:Outer membrane protein with beta-barrel domain n=1 Tax=Pedobacter duraquae TaxID=425511 RepID=A0A4R6IKI6_9SPHI|nr:outer membrane beta-barrel protein [Pedobacter duraquae]TDO22557.1 outer membrane protein with beta-barrel domain [Pedobacter duraquae]
MKKRYLLCAVLCIALSSVHAQTEKGNNFIGGSISYSRTTITPAGSQNVTTSVGNYFNVSPKFGHFIKKNLAIGLSLAYVDNKNSSETNYVNGSTSVVSSLNTKERNFSVGPIIRYYIDVVDKFKFFGQGSLGIGVGKSSQITPASAIDFMMLKYKYTTYNASANPGFAFFPTKKLAFEFSFPLFSYNNQDMKADSANPYSQPYKAESFSFGLNTFVPSIGANFHF